MSDFQQLETNPNHFDAIALAAERFANLAREAAQYSRDGEHRAAIGTISVAKVEAENMRKVVDGLFALQQLAR
jgi:hypothetical protein